MILNKRLLKSAFNMDALCLCLSAVAVISFSSSIPTPPALVRLKKKKEKAQLTRGHVKQCLFVVFFMIPIAEGQT